MRGGSSTIGERIRPTGLAMAVLMLAVGAVAGLGVEPKPSAASADLDCSDFSTQAGAQQNLLPGDPHGLDGDGDGVACKALPCPCSAGSGSGSGGGGGKPKKKVIRLKGKVTDVVDGDTIDVRSRSREIRVRLIGIDTPEVFGGTECGGPEASATMKRLAEDRRVKLVTDPTQDTRDRYGRLLAYANVINGPSLQLAILRKGWAKVYVYGGKPFKRVASFRRAESAARGSNRGAWGLCGPGF
jgi:endonuclease YncB( thermonuclease family)